jgi:hypothetical protein
LSSLRLRWAISAGSATPGADSRDFNVVVVGAAEEARIDAPEKGVVMAGQITLTDQEARALSSLLDRASDRLATYEEQTHQDRRLAEEIREAASDLANRVSQQSPTA